MSEYPRSGIESITPGPAAGVSALLLVESLIHHLISRSILSVREAIEIIDIAAEVEREIANEAVGGAPVARRVTSLTRMASSLRLDLQV